jgi:hypothetical protein
MAVTLLSIRKIVEYTSLRKNSLELRSLITSMRRAEKDFLLLDLNGSSFYETGKSNNLTLFEEYYTDAKQRLKTLQNSPSLDSYELKDSLQLASDQLLAYNEKFQKMVKLYKERGYKDWGLEGQLREAIHKIEKGNEDYDKVLMLTLRRNEKDFFLRKDFTYLDKFENVIEEFRNKSALSGNSSAFFSYIDQYSSNLHRIAEIYKQIGINEEDGMRGEIRLSVLKTESIVYKLAKTISVIVDDATRYGLIYLISLFTIQFSIGIYLSNAFAKSTTESVHEIKDRIEKLSQGLFPEKIIPKTSDEIGVTSHALNNLIDRIRAASDFAGKIGQGELNITYDQHFTNDVLATSLQNMHVRLKEADEENKKRNWTTAGLAKFGDILRQAETDLEKLSQNIISNLVKYLNANQGQIYVAEVNEDDKKEFLQLTSTYAWNREKFMQKIFHKGEGLIGQAWIESQTIYLTEVPQDYISITSGLGVALPGNILIVPMKINGEIYGVIELAAFRIFEPYQIEFVEKLAEVIASTLSTHKINMRTRILLLESQQQAEELRAQEESVRQNQEEMMATQEEMTRQRKELEEKIAHLENQLILARSGKVESTN